ncbi:hypothetical protein ALC57_04940, partial [Trachymyrmex cornetzi]
KKIRVREFQESWLDEDYFKGWLAPHPKYEVHKLVQYLQTCKFSILIDEITTQLLDLISVDAKDSSTKIFLKFLKIFSRKKKEIPINNIVGMASDNVAVMIGCNNSFMTRLKLEVPGLVTLNYSCHSAALVASKACEQLPQSCENLIRNVTTYISGSAKRCAILDEFQEFFNVERNKILKLSNTRWLVLQKCIVRFLDNWEVLRHYFIFCVVEEKSKSAEIILNSLNDISIKAYLLFLKYSLNFLNNFNALFQSRKVLIHTVYERTTVKNKKRNRLLNETISAICVTQSSSQAKGNNCINFEVLPDHSKLHNSRNLYGDGASDDF